jgi:hypothetical protein
MVARSLQPSARLAHPENLGTQNLGDTGLKRVKAERSSDNVWGGVVSEKPIKKLLLFPGNRCAHKRFLTYKVDSGGHYGKFLGLMY